MGIRGTSKLCSTCGSIHNRIGQRNCLSCHNAYMREWRKTHHLDGLAKKKDTSRHIAGVYKRRGLIIAKPCEVCGSKNVQMHHDDYNKPLSVRWLCVEHHRSLHKQQKGATK